MAKRRVKSQIDNLTFDHKKLRIVAITLHESGMQHIIGMLLMKTTTFLVTSFQSEVYTQS